MDCKSICGNKVHNKVGQNELNVHGRGQYESSGDRAPALTHGRGAPVSTNIEQQVSEVNDLFDKYDPNVIRRQKDIIESSWPETTEKAKQEFPEFCKIYDDIKAYSLPNFLGAKIPVASDMNIANWEEALVDYHDKDLVVFLKYGWPVGFHNKDHPVSIQENHRSAQHHPTHVQRFIDKELGFKALAGPFTEPPFKPWCRLSPLMTREKKDSHERRVIMDLSFPEGHAPNDGIDINCYFGRDISYSLPSINDLITVLQNQGREAYIWKAGLQTAQDRSAGHAPSWPQSQWPHLCRPLPCIWMQKLKFSLSTHRKCGGVSNAEERTLCIGLFR